MRLITVWIWDEKLNSEWSAVYMKSVHWLIIALIQSQYTVIYSHCGETSSLKYQQADTHTNLTVARIFWT